LQRINTENPMAITEIIGSGVAPLEPFRKSNASAEEKKTAPTTDRADLSEEALSLIESGNSKRVDEVLSRINSGFYNKPEVVNKIVEEILKDIRNLKP